MFKTSFLTKLHILKENPTPNQKPGMPHFLLKRTLLAISNSNKE